MAELSIEGKVVKVLKEVTGEGKNGTWTKQNFVIETEDQYPKMVAFSAWTKLAPMAKNLSIGDKVKIYFNPESREYNERWFTDLTAWRIETTSKSGSNPVKNVQVAENDNDGSDLPF